MQDRSEEGNLTFDCTCRFLYNGKLNFTLPKFYIPIFRFHVSQFYTNLSFYIPRNHVISGFVAATKPVVRHHYRGAKMALWLDLIPRLHRSDNLDVRYHLLDNHDNLTTFEADGTQWISLHDLLSTTTPEPTLSTPIASTSTVTSTTVSTTLPTSTFQLSTIARTFQTGNATLKTKFTLLQKEKEEELGESSTDEEDGIRPTDRPSHEMGHALSLSVTIAVGQCPTLPQHSRLRRRVLPEGPDATRAKADEAGVGAGHDGKRGFLPRPPRRQGRVRQRKRSRFQPEGLHEQYLFSSFANTASAFFSDRQEATAAASAATTKADVAGSAPDAQYEQHVAEETVYPRHPSATTVCHDDVTEATTVQVRIRSRSVTSGWIGSEEASKSLRRRRR